MAPATKLTKKMQTEICKHLREGLPRRAAAGLVGVDENTLSRWYHRGANELRGAYRTFCNAVNRAEAQYIAESIKVLNRSGKKNPKVIQWNLSRRFPDLYGRRDNVAAENPEDKAAQQASLREDLMDRLAKFLPEEQVPVPEEEGPEEGARAETAPAEAEGEGTAAPVSEVPDAVE